MFFAKVSYERSDYMVDGRKEFSEFMVIHAENEDQAREKIEDRFESMTSSYDRYYSVRNIEFFTVIE